ncbi:MAG: DUF4870 domain-containing protein [Ornithinibacter sp.]
MSEQTPRPDDTASDPTAPFDEHPELAPPTSEQPPAPEQQDTPERPGPHETPVTEQTPPPPPPPPAQQPAPAQEQAQGAPYGQPVPYAPSAPVPMSPNDERTTGMAAHAVALVATIISAGLLSFVAALVMYIVFKDRGPFVRHHTANSLNVQIIVGIVFLVSIPLMFVLIGFLTFAAAWLFAVIVHLIGAIKANNGEWYAPPLTPQFVK